MGQTLPTIPEQSCSYSVLKAVECDKKGGMTNVMMSEEIKRHLSFSEWCVTARGKQARLTCVKGAPILN
jgi:hypothetical protein